MAGFQRKLNEFSYIKYKFTLEGKQSNLLANLLNLHEKLSEIRRQFLADNPP